MGRELQPERRSLARRAVLVKPGPDPRAPRDRLYRGGLGGHIRVMSILKIARMGHPVLRGIAAPIADPTAPAVKALVADMIETLVDIGGAGLAAPQVHVASRLVIFKVAAERTTGRPADLPLDLTVLINPEIEPLDGPVELGWEGCLSIPGLRGAVPRAARIRYRGLTLDGSTIEREVEGFHARVVQHECDHLDGILYPQRMTDHRLLMFIEEWQRNPIDLSGLSDSGPADDE
jgi:peptide deformylase